MSRTESGMTIIEMMIGVTILAIVSFAGYQMWMTTTRTNQHSKLAYGLTLESDEMAIALEREFRAAPADSVEWLQCSSETEQGDQRGCRGLRFQSYARDEVSGETITIATVCRRASAPLNVRLKPYPMANCYRSCPGNYAIRIQKGNAVIFYPRNQGEVLHSAGACFDQKGEGLIVRLQHERQYADKQRIKNFRNLVIEDYTTYGDNLIEIADGT